MKKEKALVKVDFGTNEFQYQMNLFPGWYISYESQLWNIRRNLRERGWRGRPKFTVLVNGVTQFNCKLHLPENV